MARTAMVRIAALFGLWLLGMGPHWLQGAVPTAAAGILFFAGTHYISRWLGLGGLAGLGLYRHPRWGLHLGLGFLVGGLAVAGTLMAGWALGRYEVLGLRPLPVAAAALAAVLLNHGYVGFWEELLFRGYVLRALPAGLSRPLLLLISSLIFAGSHVTRLGTVPHYYWLYWFLGGVAFALPLLLTRSLWTSVGLHWGQNTFFVLLLVGDLVEVAEAETYPRAAEYLELILAALLVAAAWLLAARLGAAGHRRGPGLRQTAS